MRRGRLAIGLATLVAFVVAPGVHAATPQAIYKDYSDNGRLDGRYTTADLQRALKDAVIQGYGRPSSGVGGKTAGLGLPQHGLAGALPATRASGHGALPFTGMDLTLMTLGGGGLLLLGGGLRRVAAATDDR